MATPNDRLPDFSNVRSGSSSQALPEAEVQEKTYTVVEGDTLWKIADHFYGDGSRFKVIFEANTHLLKNSDLIHPGQVLKIPRIQAD